MRASTSARSSTSSIRLAALRDLPEAVARLADAVRSGQTILVHGDYDVDGMCSTALMVRSIRALGGRAVPFIPDRRRDGYDLGAAGVAAAQAAGAAVVLTCDCGTTAYAAAEALRVAGITLIIADHHLPGGPLPHAFAVLNPRRADDESPDKDLAAVGVAFKLALALTRALGGNENVVLNSLDLVALATVADVAALRGENRVFVRRGLALMSESKSAGIRALIRSAGLEGKEITAGRVGYILAPRLNALGRLDQAIHGVELLLAERDDEANSIARLCEERNRERQEMDRAILDNAMRRVEKIDLDATYGIVLADRDWHAGVIGIVASRLVEQTTRPVFLIAVQDGIGKGSGRSISAFDPYAALAECGDVLTKHGGHRMAAGLTVEEARDSRVRRTVQWRRSQDADGGRSRAGASRRPGASARAGDGRLRAHPAPHGAVRHGEPRSRVRGAIGARGGARVEDRHRRCEIQRRVGRSAHGGGRLGVVGPCR